MVAIGGESRLAWLLLRDSMSSKYLVLNQVRWYPDSILHFTGKFSVSQKPLVRILTYHIAFSRLSLSGLIAYRKVFKHHEVIIPNMDSVIITIASLTSTRSVFNVRDFLSSSMYEDPTLVSRYLSLHFATGGHEATSGTITRNDLETEEMQEIHRLDEPWKIGLTSLLSESAKITVYSLTYTIGIFEDWYFSWDKIKPFMYTLFMRAFNVIMSTCFVGPTAWDKGERYNPIPQSHISHSFAWCDHLTGDIFITARRTNMAREVRLLSYVRIDDNQNTSDSISGWFDCDALCPDVLILLLITPLPEH